tara:strand:- start:2347 stop:2673 length:327 start_codon:yes stop_codon:yes gene_type:complete
LIPEPLSDGGPEQAETWGHRNGNPEKKNGAVCAVPPRDVLLKLKKALNQIWERLLNPGGIRTHETRKSLLHFQGSAINRSATGPQSGGRLYIETTLVIFNPVTLLGIV